MANLTVRIAEHSFAIPKKVVLANCDFFDLHPDLYDSALYDVESDVDVEHCETFLNFLRTQEESLITRQNRGALLALGEEFSAAGLIEVCVRQEGEDAIEKLSGRVSDLEESVSEHSQLLEVLRRDFCRFFVDFLNAKLSGVGDAVRSLRTEIEDRFSGASEEVMGLKKELKEKLSTIRSHWESSEAGLTTSIRELRSGMSDLKQLVPNFPIKQAKSLDGIISYLTKKHRGNVHQRGIVTITAKPFESDDWGRSSEGAWKLADLTSSLFYSSKDEVGQWTCWDFHERRVRLSHYTIKGWHIKSWIVEGSRDGVNWTEIDRQTNVDDFKPAFLEAQREATISFAISVVDECRFIRLTQTDTRMSCTHWCVVAVEFFGALLE
jgi:hypothetical protein